LTDSKRRRTGRSVGINSVTLTVIGAELKDRGKLRRYILIVESLIQSLDNTRCPHCRMDEKLSANRKSQADQQTNYKRRRKDNPAEPQ